MSGVHQTPEQFMEDPTCISAAKQSPEAAVLHSGLAMIGHILECILIEKRQEAERRQHERQGG